MEYLGDIPRATQLRPPRRRAGGREYIGPKIQVNVPEDDYDFVVDLMKERKWGQERWADALREVFAAGVGVLRSSPGGGA